MSSLYFSSISVTVFLLLLTCLPNTLPSPTQSSTKYDTLLEQIIALLESFVKNETSEANSPTVETELPNFDCGGQDESPIGGKIHYPDNGFYAGDKQCVWKIQAQASKVIKIQVVRTSAETPDKDGVCDKLEIIDVQEHNSTLLVLEFCGVNPSPKMATSKGSEVLVHFTSDRGIGNGGFLVTYKYSSRQEPDPEPKQESCAGSVVVVGSNGVINSGYPAKNSHCVWRIIVPLGTQVQIRVVWLNMTKSRVGRKCKGGCCKGESLIIRDGDSQSARPIETFCDSSAYFPSVVTTNNTAIVEMKSEKGACFQLRYRTLSKNRRAMYKPCEGQMIDVTGSEGDIQSPNYGSENYPDSTECCWRIRPQEGETLLITIKAMDLEKDKSCRYDYLAFCDGLEDTETLLALTADGSYSSSNTKVIGRYCGNSIPQPFKSHGSPVSIVFSSDESVEGGGFLIHWETIRVHDISDSTRMTADKRFTCNGKATDLRGSEGVIYTPTLNNGKNYPTNIECRWRITVEPGMLISLTFEWFCLEPPTGKECYDAVSIFDGEDESASSVGVYCGTDTPPDFTSTNNYLSISFLSDKSETCTGFLARYTAIAAPTDTISKESPRSVSCGVPDVMPLVYTRIVGGVKAIAHSWPWMCSLRYKPRHSQHWCGAVIIHSCWIATAAHCVYYYGNETNFRVVVGDHNLAVSEGTEVTLNVEKVVIEPRYESDKNTYDVALLKLSTAIAFGRTAKPVCICDDEIQDGTLCVVTGWGDTRVNGSTGSSNTLNQLEVPIIKQDLCNQRGWYNGDLTNTMLCAGFPDGQKDSCQGDSGGPLVRQVDGHWCLVGITSWGFDCAQPNHPGVYTRMSIVNEWVREQIKDSRT